MRVKVYRDRGGEYHFVEDASGEVWPRTWEFLGYASFPLYVEDGSEKVAC